MLRTHRLQAYAGLATVQGSHEAPAFVLQVECLSLGLKVSIELRKFLPELVKASLEELIRHEEILLYIFLFYAIACLTGEDNELANHVHTTEVDTWVWLTVTLLLRQFNGL